MSRALGFLFACGVVVFSIGCGKDTPATKHIDPATWCDHVSAGPSGTQAIPLDLSEANAAIRAFGGEQGDQSADVALADALTPTDALTDTGISAALDTYDGELLEVCKLPADDTPLPKASVELQGSVAVVHPGTGTVNLPAGATAVAVDLRNLPNAPGVDTAVENAVALALPVAIARPLRLTLGYVGAPDEMISANTAFGNGFQPVEPPDIPSAATTALPLAVITGARLPPAAAEIAFELRRRQKAWIFGEDVRAAVAEACWHGVGGFGLAFRCREMGEGDTRWSDFIPADKPTDEIQSALGQLPNLGEPTALVAEAGDRPLLAPPSSADRTEPSSLRLGDARAALLIAHGTARLFSPFAATRLSGLDDRLLEVLGTLGQNASPDRPTVVELLNRFSQALADGQAEGADLTANAPDPLPLILDVAADGAPAVRASAATGVNPGDEIVKVGSVDIATWLADQEQTISASTPGDAVQLALWRLVDTGSDVVLTLKDTSGATRDVTVSPASSQTLQTLYANTERPNGDLSDLGAPQDYYLNLDASQVGDPSVLDSAIQDAQGATGMVVDLRGELALDPLSVASKLIADSFTGSIVQVPFLEGLESASVVERTPTADPAPPTFDGNVVLVVGPGTADLGELIGMILVDTGRAGHVIGRTSAGTAGASTGLRLPGQFGFRFTGESELHQDRSTFEGIGLVPDVSSAPSQTDLAIGTDRELQDAITELGKM